VLSLNAELRQRGIDVADEVVAQDADTDQADEGERHYDERKDRGNQLYAERRPLRQIPKGLPGAAATCLNHEGRRT
jgi:hypothetical protein